jgi:hypothetical protein
MWTQTLILVMLSIHDRYFIAICSQLPHIRALELYLALPGLPRHA